MKRRDFISKAAKASAVAVVAAPVIVEAVTATSAVAPVAGLAPGSYKAFYRVGSAHVIAEGQNAAYYFECALQRVGSTEKLVWHRAENVVVTPKLT